MMVTKPMYVTFPHIHNSSYKDMVGSDSFLRIGGMAVGTLP